VTRLGGLGYTTATLWVLDGNDRAIDFYRRAGWSADGVTRTDVGPGGAALVELRMRRSVSC
jgi:hypothetical protein